MREETTKFKRRKNVKGSSKSNNDIIYTAKRNEKNQKDRRERNNRNKTKKVSQDEAIAECYGRIYKNRRTNEPIVCVLIHFDYKTKRDNSTVKTKHEEKQQNTMCSKCK